jgi:hypothetical protein
MAALIVIKANNEASLMSSLTLEFEWLLGSDPAARK